MADARIVKLPTKHRSRRTQAERTARTRARILAATVESLDEVGFQRTTAAEITRRAGLTWGAVQHHFGGKEGILEALLADSFDRFAAGLAETFESLGSEAPIETRIDAFIDSAWAHFGSANYRATFEILLEDSAARRVEARASDDRSWQGEILKAWTRIWRRLFPDVSLGRRRALMIQHYTISTLSGLASMQRLAGEPTPFLTDELGMLKRLLAAELRATAAAPAAPARKKSSR